jgi:MoaA/NifB/PqqE/SkfB family radical SAM enzyme
MHSKMDGNKLIFRHFENEHYSILFNQKNGFFIRQEDKGFHETFWSKNGPELLDISITNYCSKYCSICYRDSNVNGKHISLEELESVLIQAKNAGVLQIALGGGNPNEHPEFSEILRLIRKKYDIVPSYTTNGNGLNKEIIKSTAKYCGAVAISSDKFDRQLVKHLEYFTERNIKTNVHFVLTAKSREGAITFLESPGDYPQNLNAIIFLNYKPVGNKKSNDLCLNNSSAVEKFFKIISTQKYPFKIGFDSCCISGLAKYTDLNSMFFDYCEAGRFSAFIDEELNMYPCSFMVNSDQCVSLKKDTMIDIWKKSSVFNNFRALLSE